MNSPSDSSKNVTAFPLSQSITGRTSKTWKLVTKHRLLRSTFLKVISLEKWVKKLGHETVPSAHELNANEDTPSKHHIHVVPQHANSVHQMKQMKRK